MIPFFQDAFSGCFFEIYANIYIEFCSAVAHANVFHNNRKLSIHILNEKHKKSRMIIKGALCVYF